MPVLLSCALALWLYVAIAGEFKDDVLSAACSSCNFLTRFSALLCYVAVALMLNSLHLFERRIAWLMSLFLWLVAVSMYINYDLHAAFSVMALMASVTMLFSCQLAVEHERALYTVFALLGGTSLMTPVVLLLLPIFVAFTFFSNIITVKRGFAMLLGLLTPYWLLFGIGYVYEPALAFFSGIKDFFVHDGFSIALPPFYVLLSMLVELLVFVPSSVFFFTSSFPGKPLLRKRLLFVFLFNLSLLLLTFFVSGQSELLYAFRIPGCAVMMSYLFVQRITKLSNIYFIFVNLIWISLALYCLWMELF